MSRQAPSWVTCIACGTSWPPTTRVCPADGTRLVPASAEDDDKPLAVGTKVGEYVIENLLGVGGMGEVYGARHPVIGKQVAVKVMNRSCSENPHNVQRFVQEAKSVNAIGHPNIVDIFSFGNTADGRCYFVMEWLRGESLRARMAKAPVPIGGICDILDGVLQALEAAHAAEIVHRDLKPDNIFIVAARGKEPERIKLLDFGIAKLSGESVAGAKASKTQTGTVVGTPSYMAPEQASGGVIQSPSDIYSLGVVAFELATRRLPFEGESTVQVMAMHVLSAPPRPIEIAPTISPALDELIVAMLAKAGADRPTATDVRERLADIKATVATAAGLPTQQVGQVVVVIKTPAMPAEPVPDTAPDLVEPVSGVAATVVARPTPPAMQQSIPSAIAITPPPASAVAIVPPSTKTDDWFAAGVTQPGASVVAAVTRPSGTIAVPPKRRTGLIVGMFAATAAIATIIAVVATRGHDKEDTKPVSVEGATPRPPPPAAPTPPAVAPPPAPAPAPPPPVEIAAPAPAPTPAPKARPHPIAKTVAKPVVAPPPPPATGSATPAKPKKPDVDAVRDPFAEGGK